ncbi:hypothetical protein [Microbacterium sp. KR10-403]|uniref:hypothetical protein n=1 Tax=Microbacterium sp. KR10-403 TaxID=3158581 RepID=UPI0032E457A8
MGKTDTLSYKGLHVGVYEPGRDVLIVSPTQRQSDEMLQRVRAHYRALAGAPRLVRDNASELGLANGSRVVSLPGSEGGIRGFSAVRLLIVDEASRVPDDVWASVLPMVSARDGQIIAASTPWGDRGWWAAAFQDEGADWERTTVSVYESAQYSPERIARTRAAVSSFVWASDYEVRFADVESQAFGTEDVRRAFAPGVEPLEVAA